VLRNPIPKLVFLTAIVAVAGAYWLFQTTLLPRYAGTRAVLASRSELRLGMTVRHATGPITQEDYTMSDIDGLSSSTYRAQSRNGVQITIAERPRKTIEAGPNVAYFFQQAVADGIWELTNKPPRGDAGTEYTIDVYQRTGDADGSRRFVFTDPHYWATTGGHQFHLILDKNKPVPNLVNVSSTTLIEPRYQKLVDDFRSFGPQSFREKIAAAQSRLKAHG
jgi:hypothetical protein